VLDERVVGKYQATGAVLDQFGLGEELGLVRLGRRGGRRKPSKEKSLMPEKRQRSFLRVGMGRDWKLVQLSRLIACNHGRAFQSARWASKDS